MSGGSQNFAAIVAKVEEELRPRTMIEMKKKIKELRSKLTEFLKMSGCLLVQITGKNGRTSIPYEESIDRAYHPFYGEHIYYECKTDPYTLPLNAIEEIEIRLGGVVMQRIETNRLLVLIHFEQDYPYESENQMKYITLYNIYKYRNINNNPSPIWSKSNLFVEKLDHCGGIS